MKRLTALILSIVMAFGLCTQALAATSDASITDGNTSEIEQNADSEPLEGRADVLTFIAFLQAINLIDIDEQMNEIREFFYNHDFEADYKAGIEPTLQLTDKQFYAIALYVFTNASAKHVVCDAEGSEVASYWFYDYSPSGSLLLWFSNDGEIFISMFQSDYWYTAHSMRAEF